MVIKLLVLTPLPLVMVTLLIMKMVLSFMVRTNKATANAAIALGNRNEASGGNAVALGTKQYSN